MPEVIQVLQTGRNIDMLLDSLQAATIVEIKPKCRTSRSGATVYCNSFDVRLVTNKHEHELSCFVNWRPETGTVITCSWRVDGEEVAMIDLNPSEPLARDIVERLETIFTVDRVNDIDIPMPDHVDRVTFRKRALVLEPKVYVSPC